MTKLKNFYPYSFSLDFFETAHDQFVTKLIQQIQQVDKEYTVILFCVEWQSVDRLVYAITQIQQRCGHHIVCLLTDSFYASNDRQRLTSAGTDVHFIEFDLLNLHFELTVYQTSTVSQSWNANSGKFLFLTGKPDRPNRVRLLYKFYKRKLLDHCVWSLFMDKQLRLSCRHLLLELTYQEYDSFITAHINNPDDASIAYNSAGTCHYDGYPFDKTLYEQTSFRVIAETLMFDKPIITEKIWVTIANRQPFIISGYQHSLTRLKAMGYRTFDNYQAINNYDTINDAEDRLDAVVNNVHSWLETIDTQQEQIAQDIEHNYQLLMLHMNKTVQTFTSIYRKLGPVGFEIFRIIPYPKQRASWINFYYGIKDPEWPDCFLEDRFEQLPTHVKNECINVFGYQPKQKC